jgi:hypothetical protein
MAKGLKISTNNTRGGTQGSASIQTDQAISPLTFTYPSSTSTSATVYRGGTGGIPTGTTSLVIQVNYKMADDTSKTDGYIVRQKGSKIFNVQSSADTNPLAPTLTRCVLVGGATQPTLLSTPAPQCYIKCVDPTGVLFYATRITDRYVWKGTGLTAVRYPYVLGTTAAVTYADSTSTTSVVMTSGGNTYDDVYAIVEGF